MEPPKLKMGKVFLCVLALNLITLIVLVCYYSGGGSATDKQPLIEDYNSEVFKQMKEHENYNTRRAEH